MRPAPRGAGRQYGRALHTRFQSTPLLASPSSPSKRPLENESTDPAASPAAP
eukprot:CAMPEP_0172622956 /NCGR_PEP_ID=MMETSP1068-20121228/124657_1 /TAXON_ID=35684 /ORGANISM="Pseudopedinella elastica, Strain CCMP716" /LENGTH=51 /DNA_ID=CAMNT_0013431319 /DNA_START=14 /DNA_END=166 /DNA_ORIENTATION=-